MGKDIEQLNRELAHWRRKKVVRAGRVRQEKARLAKARRLLHIARVAVAHRRAAIRKLGEGPAAALSWCAHHLFHTEHPAGSNSEPGPDGITAWEHKLGFGAVPWCGIFVGNALLAAGVKGVTSRIAAVSLIEDDAIRSSFGGPFAGWSTDPRQAVPGDLVVLFGRGVHVEMVRGVGRGWLDTYGGNTSSGTAGSQSNGGGSFPRQRAFGDVHGVAHVRY
jgi:hypothetical protein